MNDVVNGFDVVIITLLRNSQIPSLLLQVLPLKENQYSIKTTTDFAERLSNRTVDDDEVLVSYDVSSLFTEVPL